MAKKNKTKNKRKAQNNKQNRGFIKGLFRWAFVCAIWGSIFVTGLVLWYARDLPDLAKAAEFDRRAAITFTDENDKIIARYGDIKGQTVTFEEIPKNLINAVISIEDRRFYEHPGIDILGLTRAIITNVTQGRLVQGGSTITQQLAKNMFLSHERTYKRKIQEALLSFWIEEQLTKDEIITAYLNRVYLGSGAYGVDAAARIYYNKPVNELTLYESATIAGLLKAPSRYSPKNNPALAKSRAETVISAMRDAGHITQSASLDSSKFPIRKPTWSGKSRHFTDWTLEQMSTIVGTDSLIDGDLKIQTTLSTNIQKAAEKTLYEIIKTQSDKHNFSQAALLVMRNDGAVLAMFGGYKTDFNRTTQALRPPGSAFKPIIYLAALEDGWEMNDTLDDSPFVNASYKPKNFNDKYQGVVTLDEALTHSLNTASVRLLQHVGINDTIATARKLGINSKLNKDLTLALGSSGIPLIEMTTAYATISNGGKQVTPYSVRSIMTSDDTLIYEHTPERPKRIFSKSDIKDLDQSLKNVIQFGTGQNAKLNSIEAAGKTGTSQDHRDALFIGYAGPFICAVWLGNDDNTPTNKITGGSLPAEIWKKTMNVALNEQNTHKEHLPASDIADTFYNILYSITGNSASIETTKSKAYND